MAELGERIAQVRECKKSLKLKLMRESNHVNFGEEKLFEYKLQKYLYELKMQPKLKKHYNRALALVTKFRNRKPPEGLTVEQYREWEKGKLTCGKVLAVLERYIRNQYSVPRREIALVRTRYGFKLKEYAPKLLDKANVEAGNRYVPINELITGMKDFPGPVAMTPKLRRQYASAKKGIERKRREYERQSQPYPEMKQDARLASYIERAGFVNKEGELCRFTELQKHDMNLIFQKRYALLNWQQGSGKTAVAYHFARYLLPRKRVRNAIVLAPAIAINLTWEPFLKRNQRPCILATNRQDLAEVPPGHFILVSLSLLGKLERELKRFMKIHSHKVCLIFDESDEITNPDSMRTQYALNIFRRSKYKLLATGTTTRNHITELYSQFELLYNNSVNMMCWCRDIHYQERESREIVRRENDDYGRPFPARGGARLFKSCFCPAKASVFGIEKQNQDIYNKEPLRELIGKSILTRKFKEFAGEKYRIITHNVEMHEGEREVYRIIMQEFLHICDLYFSKLKDSKKEAALRIVRQMQLLIRACSTPNLLTGYHGDEYPSKTRYIGELIDAIPGKVAVGCTTLDALEMYERFLSDALPERELFVIRGDLAFKRREKIIRAFEATGRGILICTQQSLKSSANIPSCDEVILETLQWNIPRMEQFYFRFIRLDSKHTTNVRFVTCNNSIEQNLMALVLTKERLNDFIKTGEVREESSLFDEFDISPSLIENLLRREQDDQGKFHISWGNQQVA